MKIISLYTLLGLLFAVLQSTWLVHMDSPWFWIDGVALLAIFLSWKSDIRGVVIILFLLGLFLDALSYSPMGISFLVFLILHGLLRWFSRRIVSQSFVSLFLWTSFWMLVYHGMSWGILQIVLGHHDLSGRGLIQLIVLSLEGGVAGYFFFPWFARVPLLSFGRGLKPDLPVLKR